MLTITNLTSGRELDASEMKKITGGWWIFNWGGTIGNPRRSSREPTRTTTYSDGSRVRDYRDNGPVWPTVQ